MKNKLTEKEAEFLDWLDAIRLAGNDKLLTKKEKERFLVFIRSFLKDNPEATVQEFCVALMNERRTKDTYAPRRFIKIGNGGMMFGGKKYQTEYFARMVAEHFGNPYQEIIDFVDALKEEQEFSLLLSDEGLDAFLASLNEGVK